MERTQVSRQTVHVQAGVIADVHTEGIGANETRIGCVDEAGRSLVDGHDAMLGSTGCTALAHREGHPVAIGVAGVKPDRADGAPLRDADLLRIRYRSAVFDDGHQPVAYRGQKVDQGIEQVIGDASGVYLSHADLWHTGARYRSQRTGGPTQRRARVDRRIGARGARIRRRGRADRVGSHRRPHPQDNG